MAGGVAMYCRPQGYLSPHLISYKIARQDAQINGSCASSSSGTEGVDIGAWWGYVGFVPEGSDGFCHFQTQQLHVYSGCQQSTGSDVCSAAA